eukprot:jgi/Botrbrau1/6083/Bobra.177_1s0021.1
MPCRRCVTGASLLCGFLVVVQGKKFQDIQGLLAPAPLPVQASACDCTAPTPNTTLLFTQDAGNGDLDAEGGGDPRAARLILTDVSPSTLYFTDTPRRVAGKLATYSFISLFKVKGGMTDGGPWALVPDNWAPNAALSGDLNGVQHTVVVTLGQPLYSEKTRTLTYERADIIPVDEVTSVDPVKQTLGGYYQSNHRQIDGVPGSLLTMKAVNLFIDSASYCGTTTDGSYHNAPLCPYADDPCKGHYHNEYIGSGPTRIWCPAIVGMGSP